MQLLVNLTDNALSHTPAGGRVLVEVGEHSGAARINVRDTGIGIAPELLPHVFERFFRGDRDKLHDRAGAGLGLALCLSIARAHGGDMRIESVLSKGTEVVVQLPLASTSALGAVQPRDLAQRPA